VFVTKLAVVFIETHELTPARLSGFSGRLPCNRRSAYRRIAKTNMKISAVTPYAFQPCSSSARVPTSR
jgi:hypothetical protein